VFYPGCVKLCLIYTEASSV